MASSALVNNSATNNGIRTPGVQTSTLLSSANGCTSTSLIPASYRTASTDATWNESSLPDKIKTLDEYKSLYSLSVKDPNRFWKMAAERLDWYRFPTTIKNTELDYRSERGVDIKWYEDGILNVSYNCLDRHIEHDHSLAQQVAIIFEPDKPSESRQHVTYGELLRDVTKIC